ncbi:aspartate/glutamate racemase family protein [Acidisphaera sp. L21]|uniref:aspartate/glutamate racemase family protein n=1 Tax=Acidisphaera sp. L21 TaxID=1641851 RepID=UPI00131AF897|nr:aspartate/glutamate racemase family protein [Acidisphaera sp. L21]
MKILVVNPNLTQAVTDAAVTEARHHAAPGTEIIGATGCFGVGIVSTDAENVVAGHAVLDMLARQVGQVDAAILAISMDTALAAAQELMPFPVIGMTAAALHTACLFGRRFGMVTFGMATRGLYLDLVAANGLAGRMTGCETIELESAAGYADTARLDRAVLDAAERLRAQGAASVVIVGAATSGMARRLQPVAPVQLLDGMACAIRLAEAAVGLGIRPAHATPLPKPHPPRGLGDALAAALHPPRP